MRHLDVVPRRAVERRSARVIYPWAYTVARHTPALTRIMLDAFTPVPASQVVAASDENPKD